MAKRLLELESKKLKLGELKRQRDELTVNHGRDFLHQQYIRHRSSSHFLKTQSSAAHQQIVFHRTQLQATSKWYLMYRKLSNIDRNIGNVEREIDEYTKVFEAAACTFYIMYNFSCNVIFINPAHFSRMMQKKKGELYDFDDPIVNVKMRGELESRYSSSVHRVMLTPALQFLCELNLIELRSDGQLESFDMDAFLVFHVWSNHIISAYEESGEEYEDFRVSLCRIIERAFEYFIREFTTFGHIQQCGPGKIRLVLTPSFDSYYLDWWMRYFLVALRNFMNTNQQDECVCADLLKHILQVHITPAFKKVTDALRSLQIIESAGQANLIRLGNAIKYETKWMAWLKDQSTTPVNYRFSFKGASKPQVYNQSTNQNALQIKYAGLNFVKHSEPGLSHEDIKKGELYVVLKYPHTLFEKGDGLELRNENATYRAEQNFLKKIKVEDLKGGTYPIHSTLVTVPIVYVLRYRPDLLDPGCPPPPIERYTIVDLAREFGMRFFFEKNLEKASCQYTDAAHRRLNDMIMIDYID